MEKHNIIAVFITLIFILSLVFIDNSYKEQQNSLNYNITKNHVINEINSNMTTKEKIDIIKANCQVYYKSKESIFYNPDNNQCVNKLIKDIILKD